MKHSPILRLRPSPSLVVSCVALLVALGGTGYAVTGPTAVGAKIPKYQIVEASSSNDSSGAHSASAACPEKTRVVGGGFRFNSDGVGNHIQVQYARPFQFNNTFGVYAYEDEAYADNWHVIAVAVCLKA